MAKGDFLGELEQVILLTLARLGDQAYGVSIRQEIATRAGRDVAIGAVYSALDRLERKGYVSSRLGEPTQQRGGRAKRYFRLEHAGAQTLERTRQMFTRLWDGLELETGASS